MLSAVAKKLAKEFFLSLACRTCKVSTDLVFLLCRSTHLNA